jgi:hypothetical protein
VKKWILVESPRGAKTPLFYFFPLSLIGEGDTGGEVTILNSGSLKNHRFFRVKRG